MRDKQNKVPKYFRPGKGNTGKGSKKFKMLTAVRTMKVDRSMPAGIAFFLRVQVAYIKKQQQIMEEIAIQNISRCRFRA